MLAAAEKEETESDKFESSIAQLLSILVEELPIKQAAKIAAKLTGNAKNSLYKQAMALQKEQG